jgi:hypothetical protein
MPDFRTAVMTLVEASWEDESGASRTVSARMEDKSAGGACIRINTKIEVGAKLRIQWRFEQFSGTAKYCRSEGKDYVVGIQRDAANSPIPNRLLPAEVPAPEGVRSSSPALKGRIESSPPPESTQRESPPAPAVVEIVPIVHCARRVTTMPPPHGREVDNHGEPGMSLSQDFNAPHFDAPRMQTKRPLKEKQAGTERKPKPMRRKWLELAPWHSSQGDLSEGGDDPSCDEPGSDGKSNGKSETQNVTPHMTSALKKAAVHSAREVPTFSIDLSPVEDIYRAAGIMVPRKGYTINKVVEMLNSEHIRGLSKEMKRVALLMALDAAGVPVGEVLQDAKLRQEALDSHEAQQRKQVEAEWARKEEENIQIQTELESVRAHYMARISRNLDGVAREKETFEGWVALKRQECQSMAEAAELCLESAVSEPAGASVPNKRPGMASAAAAGAHPM